MAERGKRRKTLAPLRFGDTCVCVCHAALAPFPSPYHSWPCGVTVSRYPPGSSPLGDFFCRVFFFFQAELAWIRAPPSPEVHGWGETGEESVLEMAPGGGCRAGRAWGIPRRLRDQILMLCAPLRARGRALHHGPTGICRAVPGACPCSISEPRPSISSVCRVWGWGLCLVAGFGDHCTQQEQAGGCHGIPEHRAGGSGPESHNTQPQLGAQKNAIWLGRAVGRGIRAACWHGGLDFRAGPHPAHHPPSPELQGRAGAGGGQGAAASPAPRNLQTTSEQTEGFKGLPSRLPR